MAPSSTTSADGQGISPAAVPIARMPAPRELVRVVMVMVVVVVVVPCVPAQQVLAQHVGADAEHQQAGDEVQPRVQVLGQHVLGQAERDQAERKTPAVWVTVTVAPSATACRAVPRAPTR